MVKEQLRDESINAKEMKRQLTRILRRMHKMKIPDAEIMNVIYNIMDAMQNQRSSFRQYKDAMFRMLFSNKPALLSLYNALNNSNYTDPEMLEITTLGRYWFIGIKNDVAFAILSELYIVEQQSTLCMNMPLRNLFYVSDTYRTMTKHNEIYRSKLLKILEPRFITFYNGSQDMNEDVQTLRLSDAFDRPYQDSVEEYEPDLELIVHVYNINKGHNQKFLDKCPLLKSYMEFVSVVRNNLNEGQPLETAVINAVDYCIEHDILADFLKENREEVISVIYDEYTLEDYKTETDAYIEELSEEIEERTKEVEEQSKIIVSQNDEILLLKEMLKKYEN